ncbi:MAG: carbon storage regulator CsrA [Planctomycetia bacterium]|nr:carbon storage regulator CsrA [Planctomycetia bacterium]
MLVLSRKRSESVVIDENIVVTVIEVRGDKVRLGIQAPRDVPVHRSEILVSIQQAESVEATKTVPPIENSSP